MSLLWSSSETAIFGFPLDPQSSSSQVLGHLSSVRREFDLMDQAFNPFR